MIHEFFPLPINAPSRFSMRERCCTKKRASLAAPKEWTRPISRTRNRALLEIRVFFERKTELLSLSSGFSSQLQKERRFNSEAMPSCWIYDMSSGGTLCFLGYRQKIIFEELPDLEVFADSGSGGRENTGTNLWDSPLGIASCGFSSPHFGILIDDFVRISTT